MAEGASRGVCMDRALSFVGQINSLNDNSGSIAPAHRMKRLATPCPLPIPHSFPASRWSLNTTGLTTADGFILGAVAVAK